MDDLMKVYRINALGLYLGETEIDPYQGIPNDIVLSAPPEPIEGKFRVYRDYAWIYMDEEPKPYIPPVEAWQVDQEKERRVAMGFVYGGKAFETNSQSQMNDILGKMSDAIAFITVDQGDLTSLRWSDPRYDFEWTAADGTQVPMTAPECLAFTRAAVRRKEALVGAARALKAMSPIPVDYYLDSYWPDMDAINSVAARK